MIWADEGKILYNTLTGDFSDGVVEDDDGNLPEGWVEVVPTPELIAEAEALRKEIEEEMAKAEEAMQKIMAKLEEAKKRLSILYAMTLTDEEAMEVAVIYPEWEENISVKVGDIYSYGINEVGDPQLYRCLQAHITLANWTPDVSVSLWSAIGIAGDNIPIWAQPTGSADAYNIGDLVHYPDAEGPIYESLIDGNIWSPDVYPQGWQMK